MGDTTIDYPASQQLFGWIRTNSHLVLFWGKRARLGFGLLRWDFLQAYWLEQVQRGCAGLDPRLDSSLGISRLFPLIDRLPI